MLINIMANTKIRINTPNSKEGIGKIKKSSPGSVVTRKKSKLLALQDNVQLCGQGNMLTSTVNNEMPPEKHIDMSTSSVINKIPPENGIDLTIKNSLRVPLITKNGKTRTKKKMENMGNILKNNLITNDTKNKTKNTITVNGANNNNNCQISDQNTSTNIEDSHTNSENVLTKQTNKSKNKKPLLESMDEGIRVDVLNKMKIVLSPEDTFSSNNEARDKIPFKKHKPKTKPSVNKKRAKESMKKEKDPLEIAEAKAAKTKQVTLSNGVVLTLALVECDYCHKSFSNKTSLGRHMLSHEDLRPHHCPLCPKKFRYQTSLKAHLKTLHAAVQEAPEFHVCHICDKVFLMEENLKLHYATHVKSENNYKCLYCNQKFTRRQPLVEHEKTHLVTGRFKCYLCDMSYVCRSRLTHHIKAHTKIKEYICQYCGKGFLRLNSIKRHVKICHGGHTIECPVCFKELKGHLKEHMRVHEQERPHECLLCGQKFTQATQLAVHRRSHTGDRPYTCRICARPFRHSNALMLHVRRHTGEKPFACPMCPISFSQLPHMKTHMIKIHGKQHAYKCSKCGESFKLKSDLGAHSKLCFVVIIEEMSIEKKIQPSVQMEDVEVESAVSLSKMRFLLALLLTMIAKKDKLKYLGFNKRPIDNLLEDALEAMGHVPCKDDTLSPMKRLKANIEMLLDGTVPKEQMEKFRYENKSTEEILMLLTDEKNKDDKK